MHTIDIHIKHNYPLQSLNTLACPATAEHYCSVSNIDQLGHALNFAQQHDLKVHVMGGGSNILVNTQVTGLVVQPKIRGRKILSQEGDTVLVAFNAGENWHQCVEWAVAHGLQGIENLALIPGDIGAAPIQNIGAYGVELKDVFDHLTAINMHTQKISTFNNTQCQFGYRDSIFKQHERGNYIITQVVLRLTRTTQITHTKLTYPALAAQFKQGERPTLATIMQAVVDLRNSKLPNPNSLPNAGSFFKNPVIRLTHLERIKQIYPDIVFYPNSDGNYKIPAAWLIDALDFKGKTINGVVVHKDQALVLTNPHRVGVEDIFLAAQHIQQAVERVFDITLEIEPQWFG